MKLILGACVFLAGSALCAPAAAQTIVTLAATGVDRTNQSDPDLQLNVFNRQDCLNDDTIVFQYGLTNLTEDIVIEAWVSNNMDCTVDTNREAGSLGCWKVSEATREDTLRVRVQDILSKDLMGTDEDCDSQSAGEVNYTIVLLPLSGGVFQMGAMPAVWPPMGTATFDLIGPAPPTEVRAGAGEQRAILSFEGSSSDDVRGYRVYCDPPRGQATLDGGTALDGGTTGCGSTVLVAGEPPPDPEATFRCGDAPQTSEEITATGLTNQVGYNVAVATIDDVGNVGSLSNVSCVTPQPVTGYFEAYRAAGGEAGGGFCAFSRRPSTAAFGVMAFALFGFLCRRRLLA